MWCGCGGWEKDGQKSWFLSVFQMIGPDQRQDLFFKKIFFPDPEKEKKRKKKQRKKKNLGVKGKKKDIENKP